MSRGKYKESEALHRRALAMRRQLSPLEVIPSAASLSGLGQSLRSQSRYDEAEAVYREVLTLRRASLPANHPRVLNSMRQLAQVLNYLDRNSEAEALFRDALRGADQVLGPDHPDERRRGERPGEPAPRSADATRRPNRCTCGRSAASRANDSLADQATQVNNLATLYEDQGRFAASTAALSRITRDAPRGSRGPDIRRWPRRSTISGACWQHSAT